MSFVKGSTLSTEGSLIRANKVDHCVGRRITSEVNCRDMKSGIFFREELLPKNVAGQTVSYALSH
jgi:hypothetical protein